MTPEDAAAAALASLPFMTWDRLAALLSGRTPLQAWAAVRSGTVGPALAAAARKVSLEGLAAAYQAAGVSVARLGSAEFPAVLAKDHEAPPVVFWQGRLGALDRMRVAVVGTRRATHYGREVARQLGRELAEAGVCVVSGLAAGIDGAAHSGSLAALGPPLASPDPVPRPDALTATESAEPATPPAARAPAAPVGVVGSGLDVVYPHRHQLLWQHVAEAGLLLSEAPLGARPEPWRFPARNRIIAALAQVLVVVESHATGGSMHTVRAAEERGVPTLVVPGPVRSRASAGTNLLLSQGCHPVCDVDDVLAALALVTAGPVPRLDRPTSSSQVRSAPVEPPADDVLAAVEWTATPLDAILARLDLPGPAVSTALAALERAGEVTRSDGGWVRC